MLRSKNLVASLSDLELADLLLAIGDRLPEVRPSIAVWAARTRNAALDAMPARSDEIKQ